MNISKETSFISLIWPHFFPKEKFNILDPRLNAIKIFKAYFDSEEGGKLLFSDTSRDIIKCSEFDIDLQYLAQNLYSDFIDTLRIKPMEIIGCLGIAISVSISLRFPLIETPFIIHPRLLGLRPFTSYSDLKSGTVGHFVAIQGQVLKVSACKPLVLDAKFYCGLCHNTTFVIFEDGIMLPPTSCSTSKCRGKYFEFQRHTVTASDYQRVKLQEMESFELDSARVPRTFEVELRGDLVDGCIAGDSIEVVGIIKTCQASRSYAKNAEAGLYQLYLLANSVCKLHSEGTGTGSRKRQGNQRLKRPLHDDDADDANGNGNGNGNNDNASPSLSLPLSDANERLIGTNDLSLSSFDTTTSIPSSSTQTAAFSPLDLNKIKSIALTQGCFGLLTVNTITYYGHDMTLIFF